MQVVSVLSAIVVPLGSIQRHALERIDREDLSGVRRKTQEDLMERGQIPSDKFLDDGIFALRKYHTIAALDPKNGHAISDTLDPFWHSQILFTQDYFKFCDDVLGGYMHHIPLDHTDKSAVAQIHRLYDYTIEVHERIFGKKDEVFYPSNVPDIRMVCRHYDCEETALFQETRFSKNLTLV